MIYDGFIPFPFFPCEPRQGQAHNFLHWPHLCKTSTNRKHGIYQQKNYNITTLPQNEILFFLGQRMTYIYLQVPWNSTYLYSVFRYYILQ